MNLFHRHQWTDWLVTDRGSITYYGDMVGWYLVQQRHCLSCGKTELSEQSAYNGAPKYCCERHSQMAVKLPRKDGVAA